MLKTMLTVATSLLLLVACGKGAEPKAPATDNPTAATNKPTDSGEAPATTSDLTLTYFNLGG